MLKICAAAGAQRPVGRGVAQSLALAAPRSERTSVCWSAGRQSLAAEG